MRSNRPGNGNGNDATAARQAVMVAAVSPSVLAEGPPQAPPIPILSRVMSTIGVVAFMIMLLSTLSGVTARYFKLEGFEWSFEVAGISFIWVTFIGAFLAEGFGENVHFDGILRHLSQKKQRALGVLTTAVLFIASGWLAASTAALIERSGSVGSPLLGIPNWVTDASLGSAAVFLMLIAIVRAVRLIKTTRFDAGEIA